VRVAVCDASPLIILAKLNRLHLIGDLLGNDIVVLQCVADEVIGERAGTLERQRLEDFLRKAATVTVFTESDIESKSLSASDRHTLTYSVRNAVDWLVADERLMRRVASEHGIAVIGILGLIVGAAKREILTNAEAEAALRDAVGSHDLRISVTLYQRVLDERRD
jgi:predicted nucleic acid-binding protein